MSSPSPGQEKTVSTVIAPEMTKPKLIAMSAVDGQERVADGVPVAHLHVAQALRAREGEVVLAHDVHDRRAHDQRVLAEVRDREREARQEHVLRLVEQLRDARMSSDDGSVMPPVGKRPRRTAKNVRSSIPSQNSGVDQVTIDPEVRMRSCRVPRRQPASVPIQRPRSVDRIVATPTSASVAGARSQISSMTGWFVVYERPRFSCSVCVR